MKPDAAAWFEKLKVSRSIPVLLAFSLILNGIFLYLAYDRSQVVRVPDGDSLELTDGRRIRLLGVDAPEKDRCMHDAALARLEQLAMGKHVRLKNTMSDGYGRILADVIVEDPAEWFSYLRWYFRQKSGTGKDEPVPPTYINRALISEGMVRYRTVDNEYRETNVKAYLSAKSRNIGIHSPDCRSSEPVTDCVIKGNVRSGVKSYYTPGCRTYGQVVVDEAFGDAWFCSGQEAENEGYALSPTCKAKP